MNKKLVAILISSLITANTAFADYSFVDPADFTGDAFFIPPAVKEQQEEASQGPKRKATLPPLKKARLIVKKKLKERDAKKYEQAPTAPTDDIFSAEASTSDYAIKDLKENFDEDMMPDGFEADEQSVEEQKSHFWRKKKKSEKVAEQEDTENIILDCDNMDYDTETYCMVATGNVNVEFVKQETVIKADKITYDRMNNTIKAEGNVRILKNGQTINGDYIFVDMNEENALIENPVTQTANIEIKAKKGYVYGDKIVQEHGSITVDESFPINFRSSMAGPNISSMIVPKDQTMSADMEKGIIRLQAKELKITQNGNLETIELRHGDLFKGKRKIFKVPAIKVYTNKNNDFAESNSWELGSLRGLGMYIGPGFVFSSPHGAVLKAIPILNYNHGIGVGGIGRYQSATNRTQIAYGTAKSKFLIRGKQKLDDHLFIQYGMNDYMNEWFLGRRRPKYGLDLVYERAYGSKDFLIKGHNSQFAHRFDFGYYHDIDEDKNFDRLHGAQIGTLRARYMMQADQNLFDYTNVEEQKSVQFDVSSQLSATLYGTGDTQVIGRIGPRLHTQYRRWMQDIGYYQSVYDDNSPLPVFDAYRYGKSNVYLREYLRLNRYVTVSWFGSINLSGDSPNGKPFQENSFYVSFGPEDFKFNLGYDFIRENTFFTVAVMMDAKGTKIDYDKLEIKQGKKAKKEMDLEDEDENSFKNTEKAPVLDHAVVEDVKTVEDVI